MEELIWRNQGESVYAGVRSSDGLPVTAKVYDQALYEQAPSRFEYEARALCALNGAGLTPALARIDWADRRALVFARPPGKPLLEEVAGPVGLERLLDLACQAAAALGALHEHRLTHRHVRPRVLLLDAASGRLVLTDLGFSLGQDRAARDLHCPVLLEGTLPYVSPEQTGRIARAIDRRSDLYSLGTVLYQLAAGQPPFSGSDVPELIHAHLACSPVPLVEQRSDLPQVVSDIIERLLAKDPVERYQSAEGLLADLQKCQSSLDRGRVAGFELRTEDQLEAFEFTERLYGREHEVAGLHSAIEQARQGRSSVVLISGAPGIGKTALVEGTRQALLERGGNFAAGKFDVTRHGAPFVALAQAVANLVDGLIAQATPALARWRTRLLDSLAGLGSALFELAPGLHALLGDQPALPPVSSLEANRRLQLALVRFVQAAASTQQPLLLFIDDLQWSDPGSLEVWQRLALENHPGLVLVGAYRTHEVGPDHPLRGVIERLEAKGALSQHLQLGALSPDAAAQLIRDALHIDAERAARLSRTLARRTEHNPLVIRRMLLLMIERQVLIRERRSWSWHDERLLDVGLPESLIDVIHTKIDALAPEPRAALLAASCLGSAFDAESLAAALDQDPVTTFELLGDLREQGLICEADGLYRFEHDGVLEAASLRLTEADRYAHHERAGRFRRARARNDALENEAFTIIGHLNRTIEREEDPERLIDLARLNLVAGSKAASSAAFESAISHLGAGLRALRRREARGGQHEALLTSQLELERARATAFSGDYAGANAAFDQLLMRPLPALRLAAVCCARVEVSMNAGQFEDAVSWGLVGLAHTGLVLPRHPSKGRLTRELLRAGWMTRGDLGRRIRELPRCEQEAIQVRVELLAVLVIAAIRVGGDIVPLLFLAGARDTFRHGTTPAAPHVLTTFGTLLVGLFGKLTAAAELADEALVLAREPGARHRSKVILASHSMLLPWTRPFEVCIEELSSVFPAALLEGDVVFAGYGLVFVSNCHLAMGVPLARLRSSAERARNYLSGAATPDVVAGQELLLGIADWLSGASDRSLDEDDPFRVLTNADPSVRCPSVVYTAALHCIADRGARALRLIETIEPSAELTLLAVAERGEYFFWRALAAAMAAERRGFRRGAGRRRLLGGLRRFQRWAKLCPENFEAKALLLEAEWTRLSSSPGKAAPLYRRAAEAAERHRRLHVAALAYERLARTCPSPELSQRRVVQLAMAAYAAWGAAGKASLLGEEFRHLLSSDSPISSRPGHAPVDEPPPSLGHVDLASVLKTTRAVTSAPNYATVVERLMAGLIENAGAQRGVLVMQGDAGWTVEIACGARGPEPEAAGVPLSAAQELVPVGMLLLVQSKRASVLFDDARDAHSLARDPYIAARRVRAAMCIPIELQSRCIGAIYLENNLSPGVFTRERIEIVMALAAQAAISLTNARLFGALRASEAEWRSLVDHAPDSIMIVDREHRIGFINHAPDGDDGQDLLHTRIDTLMFTTGSVPLGEEIDRVFAQGGHVSCDTLYTNTRGSRSLVTRISPIAIDGKVARVTLLSTDVTERRAFEEHLAQTLKLEAIGRLAGGVAHDFNNLLSVIVSSCELGLRASPGDEAHSKRYETILATTSRATGLTRQLLTFSRKGASDIECLCLNQVVEHSCSMLERLLGEDVRLERQLAPELGSILMNRSQLEQVLLNLSINARDAMPGGGTLTLHTREVDLDSSYSCASVAPGRYACLTVTDTGSGMDEATRRRVFEPFFTTKEIGRGTGLGLATVHGIVHRAGGHVQVTSTIGCGSTFDVFLPLARAGRPPLEPQREPDRAESDLPRGSETILLVEDNDDVRRLAAAMLEGQGYRVIAEATGQAALLNTAAIAAADLLLTDMLLPGLRGPELAREVSQRKPGIKLLYSSGREPELDARGPDEPSPPPLLAKPYNLAQLAHAVRSLLDARG